MHHLLVAGEWDRGRVVEQVRGSVSVDRDQLVGDLRALNAGEGEGTADVAREADLPQPVHRRRVAHVGRHQAAVGRRGEQAEALVEGDVEGLCVPAPRAARQASGCITSTSSYAAGGVVVW